MKHHCVVENIGAVMGIALAMLISSQYADGFSLNGINKIPSQSLSTVRAPSSLALALSRVPRDDDDDSDNDDMDYVRVPRGGRKRQFSSNDEDEKWDDNSSSARRDSRFNDDIMGAADRLEASNILDDYDDEEYELFSNVLIPNPILDSIDPDGAAERFPELARDPKFWFEIGLFFAFINFVSFIGPRNPYPDLFIDMANAGLPPPGI